MTSKMLLTVAAFAAAAAGLAAAEPAPAPKDVAGKQIELCMIGDSITWAGQGDCFRKELVKRIPELAFVGTHTAVYGYSHAGEGGNTTFKVLERLDNPDRVPASRYYHLLIGVNDSSRTWGVFKKNPELGREKAIAQVARPIADRILKILDNLTARPGTEKVFWGTIFPCYPGKKANAEMLERYEFRDATASAVNTILRKEIAKYGDKVVMIEYEKPLRARNDWKEIILLHPTPFGYSVVADIAAPYIRKYAKPANAPLAKFGVEVTNLWDEAAQNTKPLVPGWYTVSFDVKKVDGAKIKIDLASREIEGKKLKMPLKQSYSVAAKAGQRASFWFFTKAEGYGYNMSPITVTAANGEIANIMVEKMRPSKQASVYGKGTFVDSKSKMSLGEKFVPVKDEGPNTEARQNTPGARAARKVAPNAMRNLNKAFNSHNAALEDAAR